MILNFFAVVQLQHDIDALLEWSKLRLLSFLSVSICELVHAQSYSTSYTLDATMIDPVVKMRVLGVTIDYDMKFHSHFHSHAISAVSKEYYHLLANLLLICLFSNHW